MYSNRFSRPLHGLSLTGLDPSTKVLGYCQSSAPRTVVTASFLAHDTIKQIRHLLAQPSFSDVVFASLFSSVVVFG
jgi:hypothetical protein